MLEKDL